MRQSAGNSKLEVPMLWTVRSTRGFSIRAVDGALGKVNQFLFDDQQWTIRYLVANIGGCVLGRRVLIPVPVLGTLDWQARSLNVTLTQQQIDDCPNITADPPVSLQMTAASSHTGGVYPYGGLAGLWGLGICPGDPATLAHLLDALAQQHGSEKEGQPWATPRRNPHLRSTQAVSGYALQAPDGAIGHVADFIIDDTTWTIPYIVIAPRNWLRGKKVLVPHRWVGAIDWSDSKVVVRAPQVVIRCGPCFAPRKLADPGYETWLRRAYERLHV
jgi:hypothetical protein